MRVKTPIIPLSWLPVATFQSRLVLAAINGAGASRGFDLLGLANLLLIVSHLVSAAALNGQ
jgi:hypothetical protein